MITVLDSDESDYYGDIRITTPKKTSMQFNSLGVINDLLFPTEANLKSVVIPDATDKEIKSYKRYNYDLLNLSSDYTTSLVAINESDIPSVSVPSANISFSSNQRYNYDLLNLNSLLPNDLVTIIEPDLSLVTKDFAALGFYTPGWTDESWDLNRTIKLIEDLNFYSLSYLDLLTLMESNINILTIPNSNINSKQVEITNTNILNFNSTLAYDDLSTLIENNITILAIPNSDIPKYRYFDGEINFYANQLSNLNTYLMIHELEGNLVGTTGDLTKHRTVPLSGRVVSGEYTFIVLNENLDKILHKSDAVEGNFSKLIGTEDSYLHVVAIAKDDTKKSFTFKQINIAGVK